LEPLIEILKYGRESRNIDYKLTYSWESQEHRLKLVKTILGMTNTRDGGHIVIGVKDESFSLIGMPDNDYNSFDYDTIAAFVHNYSDPYVAFNLHKFEYEGKKFIVFEVKEFEEIPVICSKDSPQTRKGALYTRSRRIPETVELPSQSEMRELIEIATEKGLRNFFRKAELAGLKVHKESDDIALYDREAEGF
jgi:predicted HTH transcriptional regulator